MATFYDEERVQVRLGFGSAYRGRLHLYALDADRRGRRQTLVVDDGSGPRRVRIGGDFSEGAWAEFPIDVPAGGSVSVTAEREAGPNAVLSGLFLGAA